MTLEISRRARGMRYEIVAEPGCRQIVLLQPNGQSTFQKVCLFENHGERAT